jgi:glycosyltransferase involved in cell wall biosynthesis
MRVPPGLLTIVIPTRDRPELLGKCLRSVFGQQVDVPVIVSDNSTRNHAAIETLRQRYGFAYVRQSGGLTATEHFNACVKLASSTWVWMLHDDDELDPGAIEKMVVCALQASDIGVVVGGLQYIDAAGVTHVEWIPAAKGELHGEAALLAVGLDPGALSPGMIFRADAYEGWGGFEEVGGHPADYTYVLGVAYKYGAGFLNEVVGRYRHGDHQETDVSTPAAAKSWLDFTIEMTHYTIARTGCSKRAAEQLLDRMAWFTFLALIPRWLLSNTSFVIGTCRECLSASPAPLKYQLAVREKYPMLFWRPVWLALMICQANGFVGRVTRKLRQLTYMVRSPKPVDR